MNTRFRLTAGAALAAILTVTAAFALSSRRMGDSKTTSARTVVTPVTEQIREEKKAGTTTATSERITPEQAEAAALAAHPGGRVSGKTKLEEEEGESSYEVKITGADGKKYEVDVDANTGKVIESEADDDDHEDDGESD